MELLRNKNNFMKTYNCEVCGTECKNTIQKKNKFCSNECSGISKTKIAYERFLNGEVKERSTIRKILTKLYGYKCNVCQITEYNNLPISLQVDHIDGNAGNNLPNNLQLLCPNCHSQTTNYGGKNKGNGRKAKGLPLR